MKIEPTPLIIKGNITLSGKQVRIDVLHEGKLVLHTLNPFEHSSTILVSACSGTFELPPLPISSIRVLAGSGSIRPANAESSGNPSKREKFVLKPGARKNFDSRLRQLKLITDVEFVQLLIETHKPSVGIPGNTPDRGR